MKREGIYQIQQPPRIVIRRGSGAILLEHDEVMWIEARKHEAYFHCVKQVFSVRQTIGQVENALNGTAFVRIQRSIIVNTSFIRETQSWLRGEVKLVLFDGTELMCSRAYRANLDRAVGPSALLEEQNV